MSKYLTCTIQPQSVMNSLANLDEKIHALSVCLGLCSCLCEWYTGYLSRVTIIHQIFRIYYLADWILLWFLHFAFLTVMEVYSSHLIL